MNNNLPDTQTLAELKKTMSYRQLSEKFGVAPMTIWHRLNNAGLLKRQHPKIKRDRPAGSGRSVQFWSRFNTCLALIRQGVTLLSDLQIYLGYESKSGINALVDTLIADGYAEKEPKKARTLRLTEKGLQTAPYVHLVNISSGGIVEAINGR